MLSKQKNQTHNIRDIDSSVSVDWSLLKEPHGGRLRQRPLLLHTHADTTGCEGIQRLPHGCHEHLLGACCSLSLLQERLELRESLLDRTEVWREGGQEQHVCAPPFYKLSPLMSPVHAEVVSDHYQRSIGRPIPRRWAARPSDEKADN